MIEVHPFGNFVPENSEYLLLGSFVTKPTHSYEWFYANGRNQFWPIMEVVYAKELKTKQQQQQLFVDLKMALADIILACERKNNSNLDINLYNIVYNTKALTEIIKEKPLRKIFFTSKYVEDLFNKLFLNKLFKDIKTIGLICLPSPSPRYAMLTKQEKINRYKELLPQFKKC